MAIANPRQRNAESAIVHRENTIRQTTTGERPLIPKNAPEGKMWMEGAQTPSVPGANTGAKNKFTSKSPIVTSMGSSKG